MTCSGGRLATGESSAGISKSAATPADREARHANANIRALPLLIRRRSLRWIRISLICGIQPRNLVGFESPWNRRKPQFLRGVCERAPLSRFREDRRSAARIQLPSKPGPRLVRTTRIKKAQVTDLPNRLAFESGKRRTS